VNPPRRISGVGWREVWLQLRANLLPEPVHAGIAPRGDGVPEARPYRLSDTSSFALSATRRGRHQQRENNRHECHRGSPTSHDLETIPPTRSPVAVPTADSGSCRTSSDRPRTSAASRTARRSAGRRPGSEGGHRLRSRGTRTSLRSAMRDDRRGILHASGRANHRRVGRQGWHIGRT
jgi:hypothetical protein